MSEEEYQQRLKKIKEDEKEGKISSSQARSRIWLLDLEKEEADQEEKKKKKNNDEDFENDQNNDDNSDEESEEDSEDEDSEDDSEDNDSEDNSEEDDSEEDDSDEDSKDEDSEDKDSDNDESKEENSEDKDSDKDDNQNDEENNKKDDNQNDNDKKDSEDKGKNDEDSLKNNKDNDSTSKSKSDSTNANSNKAPQDDIASKRNINNQGVNTSNASGAQVGSNASTSAAGTSGAGSASAGAGAGGASAGSAAGAAGGASAGAGGAAGGASAAGGGASSLGPALGYVLLFIAVVIIMIGILFFFIGMPGLVIGKIGNAILNMRQNIEILFDGNNAANIMVDRKDVADAATYLMQMGYDLGGYGFLDDEVKQKLVAVCDVWPWRKIKDWWTSDDYTDSSNLQYKRYSTSFDNWDVTKSDNYANAMLESRDNVANLYMSNKFSVQELGSLKADTINSKILLAISSDAEVIFCKSRYLGMYLTADNATYLLRNNNTEVGNRLLKLFGANDTEDGSGLIHFWNASNINANKYIDGIDGQVKLANPEGFFGYNRVAVLRSQRLLKIKNANDGGWIFKQTYYTYDLNYITKYGFPLQLALALHLSTMAPDFAYTVAERAAYDTKVNLALVETDNNYISMSIKLDLDNDGIKENYILEQDTKIKIHKHSSTGDEEQGYSTQDEAMQVAIDLLVEGETKEDLEKEIETENQEEKIQTAEEALVTLENDLKSEAEAFELNKIPITFYYNSFFGNNLKKTDGYYNEALWDADFRLNPFVKDVSKASVGLSKIMSYLIQYQYADYKKNDEGNIVGIIIKEEVKENENVNKIKDLFTTYFRNSYFSEYFEEDGIQLGGITVNPKITEDLRNITLDQITDPAKKDYEIQIELFDEDHYFQILDEFQNDDERREKIEKEWTAMKLLDGSVYSYNGKPVFISKAGFEENEYVYAFLIEDTDEDDDKDGDIDKDKIVFYDNNNEFYGYSKATVDEIWNHFIMGEDLQIKDVTERHYWPWRKYYRLIDEEGNPVIFEDENKEGPDFIYVEGADSYYAAEDNPKGWFWRNAIPKKIAYAVLKTIYGYSEEKAETYLEDDNNSKKTAYDMMIMLKNMAEVNTKGFTKYLPFIASVTDHWYEDLDFSGCYEWVQTDTPITDRYPYEADKNDSQLVKDAADKELLTVIETVPGTLKQKAEPKVSGVSGEWIRNLIDNQKYYIYDGTGKSEEEKSIAFTDVAIDVIAMLEQINGEESQHIIRIFKELLASYNIVFEESQNTTLKKKLFCNVIATYNDENNLYTEGDNCVFYAKTAIKRKGFQMGLDVMAPIDARVVYRSADSIALELIAPGTSYDDYIMLITGFEVSENINLDDEITKGTVIGKTIKQDLKFILRDQNGAIVKNSYTMLSGTNFENFAKIFDEKSYKLVSEEASYVYKSSENDVQGFKEEEKLFIPIAGTITEKTDSSITIKNNLETHKQGEAYTDYTVTISGIKVDSSLYVGQTVSRENELGTTTKQDIVIVLKDENQNTITEN